MDEGIQRRFKNVFTHGHYPKDSSEDIKYDVFSRINQYKSKWSRTFKHVSRKIIIHPKYYLRKHWGW